MNLAYKYPVLFWNCANLIVDSGGDETVEDKNNDYGKIATAIGKMSSNNIKFSLVDINNSDYTFKPDLKNNTILCGLKGITRISADIIKEIRSNRKYENFKDFLSKVKLDKLVMVNLIKAGAFDELEKETAERLHIEPRVFIMIYYLLSVINKKNKLTLSNFNGLLEYGLVPEALDFERKIYLMNKNLKSNKKSEYYEIKSEELQKFYIDNFDSENLNIVQNNVYISQKVWDNYYKNSMNGARKWLQENQEELIEKVNFLLFKEQWDKYALGSLSKWEMQSISFYYHEHELSKIDRIKYGICNYFSLSENPEVQYMYRNTIPIYRLNTIAGTVLNKNNTKAIVTILTLDGVVNVKFSKEFFAIFNKQISQKQADGKKKVIEKSWFSRGQIIMVQGYRREDMFVGKTYKNTLGHQLYLVTDINENNELILSCERKKPQEEGIYEEEIDE